MNPYTGKPMPTETIAFQGAEVNDQILKDWITNHIPDFSQRLSQMKDAEEFGAEEGISKVYLFSAKQKVPPIYKALTTNFQNRLRFAFVQAESDIRVEISEKFGIEKWPTLLIETVDGEKIVYDGKMKLPAINEFVEPYALSPENKKEDRVLGSKA